MPITVLRGLPGSGKSTRLIELVNQAAEQNRPVLTFVCSDFPWPSTHGAFWIHRRLVCGKPGLTCPLDHFVSAAECAAILRRTPTGTLIAIEEGYSFGADILREWLAASNRGLELTIAAPSGDQLQLLKEQPHTDLLLGLKCARCSAADAVVPTIAADGQATPSFCADCFAEEAEEARHEIVRCLREQEPYPGEEGMYQPVDLPELAAWRVARPDSPLRVEIMTTIVRKLGLQANGLSGQPTYLDIGCNTGYFCHHLSMLEFQSKGVDATKHFIKAARLLDSFFRRKQRRSQQFVRYELANAYEYLRDTQLEVLDVTSAFAVLQWVMIQRSVDHGVECLQWLFSKTKRVCFLEMGYTKEDMYKNRLPIAIDRDWVLTFMQESGAFEHVEVFDGGRGGLQRDLFVGVKTPLATSKS